MKVVSLVFSLLVFMNFSAVAGADDIHILTPEAVKELIGPHPAKGSAEEQREFDFLADLQRTRTEEQCRLAAEEESASLVTLFANKGGPLSRTEARILSVRFLQAYASAGINIYLAKGLYERPRPYDANPELTPCIDKESSSAYPSGHTAFARMFARILSRLYPERSAAIMKRSDEVAYNRMIGGVHHPSDIVAGKKLGDAMAAMVDDEELMKMVMQND